MRKQIIGGLATAAALTIGVVGATAYAETPPPTPSPITTPETPKTGDAGTERNEPSYTGSIPAPKGTGTDDATSEAAESAALATLAKTTEADARAAALGRFPGATIQKASLEDENGSVVWSIELTDANKVAQDVKVDAGNGTILAVEAGGDESGGAEASEAPEAND